jgi:hypothetical protein
MRGPISFRMVRSLGGRVVCRKGCYELQLGSTSGGPMRWAAVLPKANHFGMRSAGVYWGCGYPMAWSWLDLRELLMLQILYH